MLFWLRRGGLFLLGFAIAFVLEGIEEGIEARFSFERPLAVLSGSILFISMLLSKA